MWMLMVLEGCAGEIGDLFAQASEVNVLIMLTSENIGTESTNGIDIMTHITTDHNIS